MKATPEQIRLTIQAIKNELTRRKQLMRPEKRDVEDTPYTFGESDNGIAVDDWSDLEFFVAWYLRQ